MAFLLNKTRLSAFRLHPQKAEDSMIISKRGFHVEPAAREKAAEGFHGEAHAYAQKYQNIHGNFFYGHVSFTEIRLDFLADDPSLRRFKSHKQNVRLLKRVGDVLTVIVVAGCCNEIRVKAVMREESRKVEKKSW